MTKHKPKRLSLQLKIGATFLALGIVFSLGASALLQRLVFPAFEKLEEKEARENVSRVLSATESVLETLEILNQEYSKWDKTIEFVRDRNAEYLEENMDWEYWSQIDIELVMLHDNAGNIIWGELIDPASGENIPVEKEFVLPQSSSHPLLSNESPEKAIAGLLQLNQGLMLVDSRPILDSIGQGPVSGRFTIGRFLTEERVQDIGRRASVKVSLLTSTASDGAMYESVAGSKPISYQDSARVVRVDGNLLSYKILPDAFGAEVALLEVITPGEITAIGTETVNITMLSLLIASVLFIFSSWVLLRYLVIDPIGLLRSQIAKIRKTGDLSRQMSLKRSDEIGALAHEFDSMTGALHVARSELQDARDEALAMSRSKGEFLATMSHEIRTPMNGVLGMTELLLKTDLCDKQQRLANTVKLSAKSLLNIINDILDFSKISAGKLHIEKSAFSMDHLVRELNQMMAETAQNKGVEYICRIDNKVPGCVFGDDQRIRQVLVNLLGNAINFTDQGEIVLAVEYIESWEEQADKWVKVRFSVSDTGIGIRDAVKKRIFESFSQAYSSTTRRYGGTGLGLAISSQLVDLMDGDLAVESVHGEGSEFHFTIPMRIDREIAVEFSHDENKLTGLDVLVVDDNATNREILGSHLEQWGAHADCVCSGAEALEAIRKAADQGRHYDMLLNDYHMPEMDGMMLSRQVWNSDIAGKPVMIILSSVADEFTREELSEHGIRSYLTKPILRDELFDRICRTLDSETLSHGKAVDTMEAGQAIETPSFDAEILVVEDNPVNQELILILLENYGCRVVLADNGQTAIEELKKRPFDMVIMDCQMPVMDGFEATGHIRQQAMQAKNGGRLPILALTANAMEGDRERCLSSGMDNYLSKPFEEPDLIKMLKTYLAEAERSAYLDPVALKKVRALQGVGKTNVLHRLIDIYLENSTKLVSELKTGIAANDPQAVALNAHSLKSSSANIGATRFADLCRQMEENGRAARMDNISPLFDKLSEEFAEVCHALSLERQNG